MNPFAQDEGKELVDKTKLNVLLKLFNRNDWLLFNISFNIMSMPLDFLFFNENVPSIISLSVILKSSSENICSSSNLLRSFLISELGALNLLLLSS
jgi:hypothetical protein